MANFRQAVADSSTRPKVKQFIICSIVAACLIGGYCYVQDRKAWIAEGNQLLIERSRLIELGMPRNSVKEIMSGNPNFTIRSWEALEGVERGIDELRVKTALQIGAKNWVLIIYSEDEKVVALGFRTENSVYEIPNGAPKDRIAPWIESVWQSMMTIAARSKNSTDPGETKVSVETKASSTVSRD